MTWLAVLQVACARSAMTESRIGAAYLLRPLPWDAGPAQHRCGGTLSLPPSALVTGVANGLENKGCQHALPCLRPSNACNLLWLP